MKNFKVNSAGFKEMLKWDSTVEACMEHTNRIAGACGDGYESEKITYPERAGGVVRTKTAKAYFDNLRNNTLEKNKSW